ncbi:MAG: 30S ribosome-binding factor RbfA [Firmicutes bacterium]|nr:30S ribosome-binding factor RbfA [Bacillota bacterium]
MNSTRVERINSEIMRKVSDIIANSLKDPRVTGIISVTSVKTTPDLKFCKIALSIYGVGSDIADISFNAIVASKGFIRTTLSKQLDLRFTPELIFERDTGMDEAEKIEKLLAEINKK